MPPAAKLFLFVAGGPISFNSGKGHSAHWRGGTEIFRSPERPTFANSGKSGQKYRQKPMVFGFPLSDYDCGIKRFRIESRVRLSSLPLPRTARVACYDRLRDSAIRAAAVPTHRAAVPYCVGAGVPDGPLLVPFMPLAGIFRAPARHSFARGGKRMQKRRQRSMVFGIPLRRT